MAEIHPFRAIRYPQADQSTLIAPPYDILDAPEKSALLVANPRNIVAIDLPHTPPKQAGPDRAYEAAARLFETWRSDGTLVQDDVPALYVYHQHFEVGGRRYVRKMFFARLRLEEFGTGKVFPHEQTFGGPKEDRLKLMRATRCNLSPIFGLYPDPDHTTSRTLDACVSRSPDVIATAEAVENRLWIVRDPQAIRQVQMQLQPRPVFIADGHHRYGTALNYRNEVAAQRGPLAADEPAQFVLAVFVSMEDLGAIILPTHRVLVDRPGVTDALAEALRDRFEWRAVEARDAGEFAARLPEAGPQAIGLFDGEAGRFAILKPRDADVLASIEPQRAPAWRRLSYAILHRYVIDEIVTRRLGSGTPPTIHYVKPLADAIAEAKQSRGPAFVMQPCTMAELRDVCSAGELMPQKTTYFYPKLATGLVINPLY